MHADFYTIIRSKITTVLYSRVGVEFANRKEHVSEVSQTRSDNGGEH